MKSLRFISALLCTILAASAMVLLPALLPAASAQENVLDPACQGFNPDDPDAPLLCKENKETTQQTPSDNKIYGPGGLINNIANIITIVVGIASVIMIIIGGFRYILANGEPNNISGAKDTIMYAVIGLVIALVAQALVIFVINRL